MDYAKLLKDKMLKAGLRVELDSRNEQMGYKIREAQTQKIPYTVVVGDKEVDSAAVSVRRYGESAGEEMPANLFIESVEAEIKNYSRDGKHKRGEGQAQLDK